MSAILYVDHSGYQRACLPHDFRRTRVSVPTSPASRRTVSSHGSTGRPPAPLPQALLPVQPDVGWGPRATSSPHTTTAAPAVDSEPIPNRTTTSPALILPVHRPQSGHHRGEHLPIQAAQHLLAHARPPHRRPLPMPRTRAARSPQQQPPHHRTARKPAYSPGSPRPAPARAPHAPPGPARPAPARHPPPPEPAPGPRSRTPDPASPAPHAVPSTPAPTTSRPPRSTTSRPLPAPTPPRSCPAHEEAPAHRTGTPFATTH